MFMMNPDVYADFPHSKSNKASMLTDKSFVGIDIGISTSDEYPEQIQRVSDEYPEQIRRA